MSVPTRINWRSLAPTVIAILLLATVACGGTAATPVVIEKEVVKEVIKEVPVEKEVIKEVEKLVIVEKEVLKETVVEKVVIVTPVAKSAAADVPDWVKRGKRGGVLLMTYNVNPEGWDPHGVPTLNAGHAITPMYSGLMESDPLKPTEQVCDLCSGWELAADGISYTFRLRDANWSDGKPVTAEDVVFSLDRMVEEGKKPRTGALRRYYDSSEVIDPSTVKVMTKFPSAAFFPFLGAMYMKIVPKHALESGYDINTDPENAVTSGPFRLVTFKRADSMEYERNNDYFKDGLPFVDELKTFIIGDRGRALAALETEQVLMWASYLGGFIGVEQALALERSTGGKIRVPVSLTTGPNAVWMNHTKAPFDDPRVRRAVYLAIDRKAAIQGSIDGHGAMGTPFAPGFLSSPEEVASWPGYRYVDKDGNVVSDPMSRDDVVKDPRDIEEANRLMAEAGYADGVDVDILLRPVSFYSREAPFLKEAYATIGINATLKPVESAAGLVAISAGEFQITQLSHGITIADPDEIFTSIYMPDGSRNTVDWEDPRITELFRKQSRATDPVERKKLLIETRDILLEGESHWAPVLWNARVGLVNVKVQNYVEPPTLHVTGKHEHLWIDPDAKP